LRPHFNTRFNTIGKKSTSAEAGSDIADADEIAKAIKDHIADWSDEEFDDDWKHRNAPKVYDKAAKRAIPVLPKGAKPILLEWDDIDKDDENSWPPANCVLADHIVRDIIDSGIVTRTRKPRWSEDFNTDKTSTAVPVTTSLFSKQVTKGVFW